MNKSIILGILLIVAALLTSIGQNSGVGTITNQYPNLAEAIASKMPYDTLIIDGGTYYEKNLLIDKPLTIIGINNPIIDAEGVGQVIIVHSDSVFISGLTIRRSGSSNMTENAGIKLENVHHITIVDNILEENFFGIYLANVGETDISGNTLTGGFDRESNSGNGIHLWQCENIRIVDNKITRHRDAIYLEFVLTSTVEDNFCMKNIRYGLHFMFSNDDSYINNTFKNNGAGVAVMYSHNVRMLSNNFIQNQGPSSFGILLKDISDCEISKNTFSKNTIALRLEGTNRIEVQKNNFIENGWAVFISANCSDNNFDSNNFKFNSFDVSTNGTLVMNQFNNNYWDKYEGYDLDKNGKGDIPFHPVSIFATVVSKIPESIMLYRSFTQYLMDRAEKVIPSVTPENLVDNSPLMKPVIL